MSLYLLDERHADLAPSFVLRGIGGWNDAKDVAGRHTIPLTWAGPQATGGNDAGRRDLWPEGGSVELLFFPSWAVGLMGLPIPHDMFYLYFWSMVHLVFACFCVVAWMDIKRNIVIVAGAILGRTAYALFVFASVLVLGVRRVWAVWGGISLALAVVHYVLLRLSDFEFWEVYSRAGNPLGVRQR